MDFAAEYKLGIAHFNHNRDIFTRHTFSERKFVLVDNLTECLREQIKSPIYGETTKLHQLFLSAHHIHEPSKPSETLLEELEGHLRIFYTLVELKCSHILHLFTDQGFSDVSLPIEMDSLREKIDGRQVRGVDNFYERFSKAQYRWCPVQFDLNMGQNHGSQIVPICFKEKITPSWDDGTSICTDATLWKIEVPEELVSSKLTALDIKTVTTNIELPNGKVAKNCVFAMKQFTAANQRSFEKEKRITKSTIRQDGLVRYIGWFQANEPDDDGIPKSHYNIILELAEFDLYTNIRYTSPPTTPQDILYMWESMLSISLSLKDMHHLHVDNVLHPIAHGDIKPENILRVNNRFKLADCGEAQFLDSLGKATAPSQRGTFTCGSPELASIGLSDDTANECDPLKCDIWSLACVFSMVATYVVLGEQGSIQYDRLRKAAIQTRRNTIGDSFHDRKDVLPEVTEWHKYLRAAARQTDCITSDVLNLVDQEMLRPQSHRCGIRDVCKLLEERVHCDKKKAPALVPPSIENFLRDLNSKESELDGGKSMDHEYRPQAPQRRQSSVSTGSKQQLLSRSIRPTMQRSALQYQSPLTRSLRQEDVSEEHSEVDTGSPYALGHQPSPSSYYVPQYQEIFDMWMLEAELENLQDRSILDKFSFRKSKTKSVKQVFENSAADELKDFFNGRDIIFLVDNSPSMLKHWKHASYLIKVLSWRALEYDDDGMELYFSNSQDWMTSVKRDPKQKCEDFENAMKSGRPNQKREDCKLFLALHHLLDETKHRQKPRTFIILTDAVWEGQSVEGGIWHLIESQLALVKSHNHLEPRPISFQFISFGNHPKAIEKLCRLDDGMEEKGLPDFVDTEPATGHVYKMFLGSLSDEFDQSKNTVNTGSRLSIGSTMASPVSPTIFSTLDRDQASRSGSTRPSANRPG